ncbi:MAG: 30S ribosomal protein S15 [Acidobacteriota bacterium]|nr:30S ribosomal protein S15 [Acidobacteriota bacterium]
MPLKAEKKREIVEGFRVHPKDTGSPEVQIALLTGRISYLNDHFRVNRKDHASRRGLMVMVGKRKRLLEYLRRSNTESYKQVIDRLGIRK